MFYSWSKMATTKLGEVN
jgi:hypothetical protein